MRRITSGLLFVAVGLAACGVPGGSIALPTDGDTPVLQVRSEGGFAPVEFILSQGPRYTLLADGRLISEGPVIEIYPGPLVPNYQVTNINPDQMRSVLDLIEAMGLPDMVDEYDDTNTSTVADANTEVVTYWDDDGAHKYSVYALGLVDVSEMRPPTASFQELIELLDELASSGSSISYTASQVQYVVGVGFTDPDFPDVRDWPLDNEDFLGWKTLPNGWMCQVRSGAVPAVFADATSTTQWTHPDESVDAEPFKILVRPLLPGEETCFGN